MKFSIITICFNAVDLIEETMKTVLNQDYPYIEYIIIDGGSNDGTQAVIENAIPKFEKRGICVKYTSESDRGISDAFNKGIRRATGDVIALINAGDCLLPSALEKIANNWMDTDQIIYGKTLAIDKKNHLRYLREIPNNVNLSKIAYNGLVFTHQSSFVKREVYEKYGLYDIDIKYIMDSFLFAHFYECGVRFRYLDEVLVSMLYGGISSRPSKKMLKEKIQLSEKYNGPLEKKIVFDYYKSIPIDIVKSFIRKNPKLWEYLIGKDRRVSESEYKW